MLALLLTVAAWAPQDPPSAAELIERFGALTADRQSLVVRNLERRLSREDDELLQSIASMQRGLGSYPAAPAPAWFDTQQYAPVATPRRVVGASERLHRASTAGMQELTFLPDLQCEVHFDWRTGKACRGAAPLTDAQRFANLVRGYCPNADHAVARILEGFDTDPTQRQLGEYFAHLYCDRDGAVFEGVTLFAAWSCGRQIEMPDTDGIAFARRILGTRSFVAPLPADRRRERLYEKIKAAFAEHREHRSLRLALAATFVSAAPGLDPTYEPLVRRGHFLWQQCGRDPQELAKRLAAAGDRATMLRQVDAAIASQVEIVDSVRADLADLQLYLRKLADHELGRGNG